MGCKIPGIRYRILIYLISRNLQPMNDCKLSCGGLDNKLVVHEE